MIKNTSSKQKLRTIVLLTIALLMNYQAMRAQQPGSTITAEAVKPHIIELADDSYKGRNAGYRGERKAGDYIARQFKKAGLKPAVTGGKYFQEFSFHPIHPVKPFETMKSRNVLGMIEGSDPVLKNEIVVIGAHYDGQGMKGQSNPARALPRGTHASNDEIWNSANDNATSVAAMIEIARAIKQENIIPRRTLLFIAFGSEEHGMIGSIHYVNHPVSSLENHIAMINIEKIGLPSGKPFNTSGNANSKTWDEILKLIQGQTKTKVLTANPYSIPESDHYAFNGSRIPAIMFYTSGVAAHNPDDHSDKIDFDRVAEAARFVMLTSLELANRVERPVYVVSPMPDLGISLHLVSGSEADKMNLDPSKGGFKVTGLIPGLPAAKAGIRTGDFITEFAKFEPARNESLESLQKKHMEILSGKHGDKISVTVIRDGKKEMLEMRLR